MSPPGGRTVSGFRHGDTAGAGYVTSLLWAHATEPPPPAARLGRAADAEGRRAGVPRDRACPARTAARDPAGDPADLGDARVREAVRGRRGGGRRPRLTHDAVHALSPPPLRARRPSLLLCCFCMLSKFIILLPLLFHRFYT